MIGPFMSRKPSPSEVRLTKKSPKPTLFCGGCQKKTCEVARPTGRLVWLCACCEQLERIAVEPVGTPLNSGIQAVKDPTTVAGTKLSRLSKG